MTTIQSIWNGWKKFQNFSPQKFEKSIFWVQKWQKMTKKSKIFRKFFLVGIVLEWFKTCFTTKYRFWKFFPLKIFFWDIAVLSKNWSPKNRKIFEKNFLVGINLEWSKTYFKTKISILKIFSHWNFFLGHSRFSKIGDQKFENFSKIFFWSESI